MGNFGIEHIEYFFPQNYLTNNDFDHLSVDPFFLKNKIGIENIYKCSDNESVCDLAESASKKLFERVDIDRSQIGLLILVTQNPDYILPTSACILQAKLNLSTSTMCFDINLGCSGFVYACALAVSLMKNFKIDRSLVVTSEAYSKVISYDDKTVATIFSDAAAVTLLSSDCKKCQFLDFNFGTDGTGYDKLIVPVSGSREKRSSESSKKINFGVGISRSRENLYMNGQEIMKFVLSEIPRSIRDMLNKNNLSDNSISRFFFHQANKSMLESLGRRMALAEEKVYIDLRDGNTVSSTIPIGLKKYYQNNDMSLDDLIILSGFGVGYSWANALVRINNNLIGEM